MIIRINGAALGPMNWLNEKADQFVQWEAETAANGLLWGIGHFCKVLAPMIPELAGFSIMVLITIGMFSDFAKWFARSLLVFVGAVIWLTLAHV